MKIVQESVLESSNVETLINKLDLTFSTRLIDRFSKKKFDAFLSYVTVTASIVLDPQQRIVCAFWNTL